MTYTHLSQTERYQIYALMKVGKSQIEIAHILGRHKSTISRELALGDPAVEDIVHAKLRSRLSLDATSETKVANGLSASDQSSCRSSSGNGSESLTEAVRSRCAEPSMGNGYYVHAYV